jgi:hypothetical protein
MSRLVEAGGARVLTPFGNVADVEVPQVHQTFAVHELDELETIVECLHTIGTIKGVHREACRDSRLVPDRALHGPKRFDPEARPVLERATISVGAAIVVVREELQRQVAVRAVDVDDVKSRLDRAFCARNVEALQMLDVVLVGLVTVRQLLEFGGLGGGAVRNCARLHARSVCAAIPHLNAAESAELVEGVIQVAKVDDIALVPNPR